MLNQPAAGYSSEREQSRCWYCLKAVGPGLNWLVLVAYMVGSFGVLLAVGPMIRGAYAALRMRIAA
jgi:hypothetical protein